ncbi:DUF4129 domain-containing protein [Kribbella sp. DT2]|uniref:DUF4129 domain-containing protein n=1 Tax=Kribbella sp. DT2 TaxID=3393427 RepID=UPI003CF33C76
MQPTRRSVLAVAAALVLGVAAVVLVVFASAGGSVQPLSESTRTAAPRTPPPVSVTQSVPELTAGPMPSPKEVKPIEVPDWLKALWMALVYAAAVLLVLFLLRVVYRILRKVELPQAEDDDTDWERVKVDRLAEAVESGLSAVDSGTATDAVIACWVALEEAAASAGVAREPSETPAEFTVRVLGIGGISEPELLRLAQLYREARYSTHGSSEEARAQARAALLSLREELAAAVAAR